MYLCGMPEEIGIRELLSSLDAWQIVDVRSPSEFAQGHIKGAVNLPLFDDEERARVGTLYKQESPQAAMAEGLRIAGAKMKEMAATGLKLSQDSKKRLLVHCWRGGKRSEAVEWLLKFTGAEVKRLGGGYKSFRTELQAFFHKNNFKFNIIGGYTGAGKTEILHSLRRKGEQVIDLEGMAHHKGSAFGAIGEEDQPSTEQFENDLYMDMLTLNPRRVVWLENESKNIGRVYLPEGFWRKMRNSDLYVVEVDKEIRLDRVMQYYTAPFNKDELKSAFDKIQKRLGGLEYKLAIQALDNSDLRTAATIALTYYDKSYEFQLSQWPADKVIKVEGCDDICEAAEQLVELHAHKI